MENAPGAKTFLKEGGEEKAGKMHYDVLDRFSDNIMFELAILIGVIHLSLSLLRYANRNWASIVWLLFIIGAYLYFPVYLKSTSIIHFAFGVPKEAGAQNGLYLMIGGLILATALALIQHRLAGILEPMTVIQLFADAMSYLRLYALGLSGAMLISTMNDGSLFYEFCFRRYHHYFWPFSEYYPSHYEWNHSWLASKFFRVVSLQF